MRKTLLAAALAAAALTVAPPGAVGATTTVADWQMNDPAGSSVMHDSTGAHDGAIGPNAAAQGLTLNGSYFHWSQRCSACLPVAADRVVKVPDAADGSLDVPDPNVKYTLEFRFRTTSNAGNYMQKGQSATKGGQIKVQGPKGNVQCLFKGANGVRVGTGAGFSTADGQWHTVKCVHTATQVKELVDGVRVAVKNGTTGPIDNASPFTVGGKSSCDQVKVTCDYFVGDIDYVKVISG